MIIDASNAVVGRLASTTAKKLMSGEKILIINSENAIMTGNPSQIRQKYIEKRARGSPQHGPFFPKKPDLMLRRIIRGMLPYKKPSGRNAMKRLRIFIGFPQNLEGKHVMTFETSSKEIKTKYITLGNLAKSFGWHE